MLVGAFQLCSDVSMFFSVPKYIQHPCSDSLSLSLLFPSKLTLMELRPPLHEETSRGSCLVDTGSRRKPPSSDKRKVENKWLLLKQREKCRTDERLLSLFLSFIPAGLHIDNLEMRLSAVGKEIVFCLN